MPAPDYDLYLDRGDGGPDDPEFEHDDEAEDDLGPDEDEGSDRG